MLCSSLYTKNLLVLINGGSFLHKNLIPMKLLHPKPFPKEFISEIKVKEDLETSITTCSSLAQYPFRFTNILLTQSSIKSAPVRPFHQFVPCQSTWSMNVYTRSFLVKRTTTNCNNNVAWESKTTEMKSNNRKITFSKCS